MTGPVDIEHPVPWLSAAIDQLLAKLTAIPGGAKSFKSGGYEVVMAFLTEPNENASQWEFEQWNQSCDNCGKDAGQHMLQGYVTRVKGGITFIITVGACPECGLEDLT